MLPGAVCRGRLDDSQALGGYVIGHRMESAAATYGFFAVVIGLLTWIYLGAQVTLLGAEVNVVLARRLWPRALDPDRLTPADQRALRDHAAVEERREEEIVEVHFSDRGGDGGPAAPVPDREALPPPGGPRSDRYRTEVAERGRSSGRSRRISRRS